MKEVLEFVKKSRLFWSYVLLEVLLTVFIQSLPKSLYLLLVAAARFLITTEFMRRFLLSLHLERSYSNVLNAKIVAMILPILPILVLVAPFYILKNIPFDGESFTYFSAIAGAVSTYWGYFIFAKVIRQDDPQLVLGSLREACNLEKYLPALVLSIVIGLFAAVFQEMKWKDSIPALVAWSLLAVPIATGISLFVVVTMPTPTPKVGP